MAEKSSNPVPSAHGPDEPQPHDQVTAVLDDLEAALRSALGALGTEAVSEALNAAIHHDAGLPHKGLAQSAARIIDLMGDIGKHLEPADTVLADHFLGGYLETKCLVAAVELGIPDLLAAGPLPLERLAEAADAKPDRLRQVLQTLAANNIFVRDPQTDTFANNRVSTRLRKDHWMRWCFWVDLYGNEMYDAARGIPEAVRRGVERTPAQVGFATDLDMFAYFQQRGWTARLHRTLGAGATAMAPGILADYPWAEVADRTVLDVGGGGGALLALLLRAHPAMRGALLDLAPVVDRAAAAFAAGGEYADLAARVPRENLHAGDFLAETPAAEVYTIKWVLHDWDDADALTILRNIRRAIVAGPASRLVVLESVVGEHGRRSERLARYGDINMMMMAGGRERTERQWRQLATDAGWEVKAILPLRNAWMQALDLRPV
jgi:hypothetical protein